MTQEQLLFAGANLCICAIIVFVCMCRLHVMNKQVLFRVRVEYAIYIGGALACAFQPMWDEFPEWGTISLAFAFLVGLLLGGIGWRDGPPPSTTQPAPLE